MLRHRGEDARGQGHVENTVILGATLLELIEVVAQALERLVLVVLSRDVGALFEKLLKLILHLLDRSLDVGLDAAMVLLIVHFGARISDDVAVLWQEIVSVLRVESQLRAEALAVMSLTRPKSAGN